MAMSNLYSKIAPKPVKRFQDNIPVSQTNAWVNGTSFAPSPLSYHFPIIFNFKNI